MLEPLPRRRRYTAIAAVLAALLALTTSCSDDPPTPDPIAAAPSTSTTPSATASPSGPPTMPAEAKGTSRKSAVAFVHHVIDVLNYSAVNLDPAPIRQVSAGSCETCESLSGYLTTLRNRGDSVAGGAWKPLEVIVLRTRGPERQLNVVVDRDPQVVRRADGSARARYKAGRDVYSFTVKPRAARWVVVDLRQANL